MGIFTIYIGGVSYIVNLGMDYSVKWVLLNKVSGQIKSDALWK